MTEGGSRLGVIRADPDQLRLGLLGVLVVALGLALSGCSGSPSQPTGAPPASGSPSASPIPSATASATQVVIYSPVAPGGTLTAGLTVSGTYRGSCMGSNIVPRPEALKCFLDGSLPDGSNSLDPCFVDERQTVVYCTDDPTSKTLVKVTLDAKVIYGNAEPRAATAGNPWAVELTDGTFCGALGGATTVVAGQRQNYGCSGAGLFGDPDRSTPVWTIFRQPEGSPSQTQASIARAWF